MSNPDAGAAGTFKIGGELTVNRLGFGALWMSGPDFWGEPVDREAALAVGRAALDFGVNLIDTADSYGPESSERCLRDALYPYPKGLVIATKGGYSRPWPTAWIPLGRPEYILQTAKLSARRLGVETIDLWQLHRIDPKVPRDEQFDAIARLRKEGVIRHAGLSEVTIEEIKAAEAHFPVATVQNQYSPSLRKAEEILDYCEQRGIGFMPWSPLGQGAVLNGAKLAEIAARNGASPSQVVLAWMLRRSPVMLPIPGTSKVAHLRENVAAAALRLSDEDFAAMNGLVAA